MKSYSFISRVFRKSIIRILQKEKKKLSNWNDTILAELYGLEQPYLSVCPERENHSSPFKRPASPPAPESSFVWEHDGPSHTGSGGSAAAPASDTPRQGWSCEFEASLCHVTKPCLWGKTKQMHTHPPDLHHSCFLFCIMSSLDSYTELTWLFFSPQSLFLHQEGF